MKQRATGAMILLLLAGATLAAPAGANAGDPPSAGSQTAGEATAGTEAQPTPSFWERFRIRGRHKGSATERLDVPKAVARTQASLRTSVLGRDPGAKAWLDLVDRGQAGAKEFNDFAAFLVRKAYFAEASSYQKAAIELEPKNATLWVNLAMIERAQGRLSNTRTACARALALDPNHALGRYVLGTVYEANKDFDRAIAEYRAALQLDPRLGDAGFNPLAAYNEHLNLVKMLNFRDQAGSIGLPMVTMTSGPPAAEPKTPPATAQPAPAKPREPATQPQTPAAKR